MRALKSFYDDRANLLAVLKHYRSIFSEGLEPIVPLSLSAGEIDVPRTLDLNPGFPDSERQIWLSHWPQSANAEKPQATNEPTEERQKHKPYPA